MQSTVVGYQTFHAGVILGEFGLLTGAQAARPAPLAGWLAFPELAQVEAQAAQRVGLFTHPAETASGSGEPSTCLASAWIMLARDSGAFQKRTGAARAFGSSALVTNVCVQPGHEQLLPALFYAAGRRARVLGATTIVCPVRDGQVAWAEVLGLKPTPHAPLAGHALYAQRLDLWMHRTWSAMVATGTTPVPEVLAAEVAETIRGWVAGGAQWSFFKALRERTLSREQYVYMLSNMYQFVRHTTRVIGRAIGASADPDLRKHWINHLTGEVNHEVIIERDLAHLGEDVAYVKNSMAPGPRTQEFMAIQESMIAYYNDPILMMASPLAAEAVTAHLDQQFADDLLACVAAWGVKDPKRACNFLISHMNTDGGEDGHWKMSIDALPRLIADEARLSLFLTTNGSSRRAIQGVFTACTDDMAVWSA
jgi:hypothetical protein